MLDRRAFLINKHFDDCVTIIEVQPYDTYMTAIVKLRYGSAKTYIDWGEGTIDAITNSTTMSKNYHTYTESKSYFIRIYR